jgi:hypothetical protein
MNQTTTPADLDARVSEALSRENTGAPAERIAEIRSRWPADLGELAVEVPLVTGEPAGAHEAGEAAGAWTGRGRLPLIFSPRW